MEKYNDLLGFEQKLKEKGSFHPNWKQEKGKKAVNRDREKERTISGF